MSKMLAKYLGGVTGITFTFASFIACGSQVYKVPVHEDIDASKAEAANPQSADKTSTLYGIHAVKGWNNQLIPFKFGKDMSPHLFRDSAATTLAIDDPRHVRVAAAVLGHRSFTTTEKYYRQSRSIEAQKTFFNAIWGKDKK